ncbi:MAG: DUF1553 domain-containing protein, partial [Planctomycetes bacterium]|nr:DUF1553 domain-containing protein [Planctomycetota bacterium]
AGDLLPRTGSPEGIARQIIATGFLMVGPKALAETDKEQTRLDIVDEQLDVLSRTFLGLTLSCARCHDHKFDPFPTTDYYALAGVLRSAEPLKDEVRNATMFQEYDLEVPGQTQFTVMAIKEGVPRNLRVHIRGNRFQLGGVVPRRLPLILTSGVVQSIETEQSGRSELANWIASSTNPLTARVMVNRIWQHHFEKGLVATTDNFGFRGEAPSHPELLDALAFRFVESQWSVKAMHRSIVGSHAYQQVSIAENKGNVSNNATASVSFSRNRQTITETDSGTARNAVTSTNSVAAADEIDPTNRLIWRGSRRRLSAEEIRDSMLAVSGRLLDKIGGGDSGEVLYKATGSTDKRGFGSNTMQSDHEYYNTPLRSVYLPVVRNALPDSLTVFDAADANAVTPERTDTTVPSQALFMMNNMFVREQAKSLALDLLSVPGEDNRPRIELAIERCLGRTASQYDIDSANHFLKRFTEEADMTKTSQEEVTRQAWQSFCQVLFCSNEFLKND